MLNIVTSKLRIQEKNDQLLATIQRMAAPDARSEGDALTRMEMAFRIRCLERLHVFMRIAADHCFAGYPVVATLLARGVMETAGLLALFEAKISKMSDAPSTQKIDTIRKFVFSSKNSANLRRQYMPWIVFVS
jgi:hypothetical protein